MGKVYHLNNGRISAEVLPSRGANLISFKDSLLETDVLRTPGNLNDFNTENPYLYGMPILFPPNRISGGCFKFEGREYKFPVNEPATGCFLHGVLHETEFDVIEYDSTHIICKYQATAEKPYFEFKHEFEIEVKYELDAERIIQSVEIKNNSKENMPSALAFHTTFNLPFVKGGNAAETKLLVDVETEYLRDSDFLPTEECLTDSEYIRKLSNGELSPLEHTISAFFKDRKNKSAVLTDFSAGVSVHYEVSDNYNYWMIYNGGADDFICVEPQTWLTNCPNLSFPLEESGFQVISPNQSIKYISVLYCTKNS